MNRTPWTKNENKLFENSLVKYPDGTLNRWFQISLELPGKTPEDVRLHYQALVQDIEAIDAGEVELPVYDGEDDGDDGGFCTNGRIGLGSKMKREDRKRGLPWTEDEHLRFLEGLEKYGKGDWRNISRWAVKTRTSTQVASHAQKYFLRQENAGNKESLKMSPGIKVFGSPTSAEVARVLACLFEKNLDFQLIRVDSYKGQKRMPDYLKLQLSGQALTFEDGDKTLVDSREIIRYIADKYADSGTKGLLGTGTLERASIEQWLQTEAEYFDPPSSTLIFHLAFAPEAGIEEDDEEAVEKAVKESKLKLERTLDIYEQRLDESAYLAGDKFTVADLSHLPNANSLMKIPECQGMFVRRRNVIRWWDKISSRVSWKKTVEMQKGPPPRAKEIGLKPKFA